MECGLTIGKILAELDHNFCESDGDSNNCGFFFWWLRQWSRLYSIFLASQVKINRFISIPFVINTFILFSYEIYIFLFFVFQETENEESQFDNKSEQQHSAPLQVRKRPRNTGKDGPRRRNSINGWIATDQALSAIGCLYKTNITGNYN